ncbi:MAG TPA: hypothetical protein DDZ81_27130 [Acetobacteraceae bacterium]|nr:hypothetical protein [Acetobacteraceae bacterium]
MTAVGIADFGRKMALLSLSEHNEFEQLTELDGRFPPVFVIRNSIREAGERLIVMIRARNQFKAKRDPNGNNVLNDYYHIPNNMLERHKRVAREMGANLAWVAVQVDARLQRFSCYFGYLSEIGGTSIGMEPEDTASYLHLAVDRRAPYDIRLLDNRER